MPSGLGFLCALQIPITCRLIEIRDFGRSGSSLPSPAKAVRHGRWWFRVSANSSLHPLIFCLIFSSIFFFSSSYGQTRWNPGMKSWRFRNSNHLPERSANLREAGTRAIVVIHPPLISVFRPLLSLSLQITRLTTVFNPCDVVSVILLPAVFS